MKRWSALLFVVLAACAQQPGVPQPATASADAAGTADSEARQRARVFTDLARAYLARGQYKVALDELRRAVQADPRFAPAYDVYGMVYMELAEDALAEDYFRRAVELEAENSEAHAHYGWFLCTRGRHDDGLAQLALALKNPLYATPEQAMTYAGVCADMKGDSALAEANLVRALKLQPDNGQALIPLAGLYFRQGRLMDARRALARFHEVAVPTAQSLWLAIRVERKLGDRTQEAGFVSQLLRRFPDAEETRLLRAGQYE
jgi:type IV pilus assembly protein PilF